MILIIFTEMNFIISYKADQNSKDMSVVNTEKILKDKVSKNMLMGAGYPTYGCLSGKTD